MARPTLLYETRIGWVMRRIICAVCLVAAVVLALQGRFSEAGICGVWTALYAGVIWREREANRG